MLTFGGSVVCMPATPFGGGVRARSMSAAAAAFSFSSRSERRLVMSQADDDFKLTFSNSGVLLSR